LGRANSLSMGLMILNVLTVLGSYFSGEIVEEGWVSFLCSLLHASHNGKARESRMTDLALRGR
jgi:hypothetical protein